MEHTILIIDDFQVHNESLSWFLKSRGYKVYAVSRAETALTVIDNHDIDLIISDFYMPGMDGIELTQRIRGGSKNQNVPILILSTVKKEEIIKKAIDAKITKWVHKPYDDNELLHIIKKALGE